MDMLWRRGEKNFLLIILQKERKKWSKRNTRRVENQKGRKQRGEKFKWQPRNQRKPIGCYNVKKKNWIFTL